jgi:hypothetical protein
MVRIAYILAGGLTTLAKDDSSSVITYNNEGGVVEEVAYLCGRSS